jgi:YfiH family protein
MFIYKNSQIQIYFGNATDQLFVNDCVYDSLSKHATLLDIEPFATLSTKIDIDNLIFPRQVHGCVIHDIDRQSLTATPSFTFEGDALITQEPCIGLGVLTADCLPIIIHDTATQAIAIIHAGWRGTVNNISSKTIDLMNSRYKTNPSDVTVYFGPSAGPCCYNVGNELIDNLDAYRNETLIYKNGTPYFDNRLYNQLALQNCGVPEHAFWLRLQCMYHMQSPVVVISPTTATGRATDDGCNINEAT